MAKPKKVRKKSKATTPQPSVKSSLVSGQPAWFTNTRLHSILLMLLAIVLYANTLKHDYTQDDAIVIHDNMYVTQGLKGVKGIFEKDTFFGFFKTEGKANLVAGGRYRPFTLLMYALEVQLFAPEKVDSNNKIVKNAEGNTVYDPYQYDGKTKEGKPNAVKVVGHLVNILLYGLTGVILYFLLLLLLNPQRNQTYAFFVALVTSALFIAHPIHTEVVANIKGRDEIMALLGSLAALYFSLQAFYQKKNHLHIVAAGFFLMALLSKENAITFLGAAPLAFFIFTKAKWEDIAWATLPLVAVTLTFLLIRGKVLGAENILADRLPADVDRIINTLSSLHWFFILASLLPLGLYLVKSLSRLRVNWIGYLSLAIPLIAIGLRFFAESKLAGGAPPTELMNNPFLKFENGDYIALSGSERMATIFHSLGKYVQLLAFPHPLTHDYYPRQIPVTAWSDWRAFGSLLLYLVMAGYALWRLPKKDPLAFGILFYLGTLLIVSNIFFPVGVNMAERFVFMPSVGFCFVVAILLYRLSGTPPQKIKNFKVLSYSFIGAGLIFLLFSIKTITRNPVWKNNFTLFTTDVAVSENSAKLQNAVGGELIRMYYDHPDPKLRQAKLEEAIPHLNRAIEIHPKMKNSFLQLGNVHNYLRQFDESIKNYNLLLEMEPGNPDAIKNLGITYREAGQYFGETLKDPKKAAAYLQRAYDLNPNDYEVLRLLGVAYGIQGRNDLAVQYFTKALALQPQNADMMWNLANAYFYTGNETKANELFQRARQIDPNVGKPKQ